MIIWIAYAKTMSQIVKSVPFVTEPSYVDTTSALVKKMAEKTIEELMDGLRISRKIAEETSLRFGMLASGEAELLPALSAYSGTVFRHINADKFTADDWSFVQEHLRIQSALYGILRPLDIIGMYRMEAGMDIGNGKKVCELWREIITEDFISDIEKHGGILLDLASSEMRLFLEWEKVKERVRIIKPEFYERRSGKLRNVTVYAKMCRGEMAGCILRNRYDSPNDILGFEWNGFLFTPEESTEETPVFVKQHE